MYIARRQAKRSYECGDLAAISQTELLDRLYLRMLRDLGEAKAAIGSGDIAGKARALDHAQRILHELELALDFTAAPSLCRNLARLYGYVDDQMTAANQLLDAAALDRAGKVIGSLRESFLEAANNSGRSH